jgi:hypothetical protein
LPWYLWRGNDTGRDRTILPSRSPSPKQFSCLAQKKEENFTKSIPNDATSSLLSYYPSCQAVPLSCSLALLCLLFACIQYSLSSGPVPNSAYSYSNSDHAVRIEDRAHPKKFINPRGKFSLEVKEVMSCVVKIQTVDVMYIVPKIRHSMDIILEKKSSPFQIYIIN